MTGDASFGFVQLEFAGDIGPAPGRYVVRRYAGDDARRVLVIGGLEAPRRGLPTVPRRPRRRAAAPEPAPVPVAVTRATVVDPGALAEPEAWLRRAVGDPDVVRDAVCVVNRAVAAHRLGAADPYVAEVSLGRALAVRVGYGVGEQVADGRWSAARDVAPDDARRRRGSALLRPQERVAALLGGRDAPLAAEELALRARLDLDQGRGREAALIAETALRAGLAELAGWRQTPGMAARLDELAGLHPPLAAAAAAALQGGLDADQLAATRRGLERLEAALRARLAALRG